MIRHLLDALKNCVGAALPSPVLNLFFGLAIPNRTHPAGAMSIPCSIPENILKFRTITTMLANLPRTIPSIPTDNLEDPQWAESRIRQELKILDAFAQLAVSQHDVVAVSTFRGLGLEMVACADQETTQTAQTEAQSKSMLDSAIEMARQSWRLLLTRNDRFADKTTSSGKNYPTIMLVQSPEDRGERTALEYMKDLGMPW